MGSWHAFQLTTSYIAHWDGNAWTRVSSPNPGLYENDLNAVTAIAPDDVWAVGEQADTDNGYQGLAVHWDGTSWELSPLSESAESPASHSVATCTRWPGSPATKCGPLVAKMPMG